MGYLLRRLLSEMRGQTDALLEPLGLTHAQWEPLFKLWKSQAGTVAELARDMQTDPSAATRLLDRLEAKGYCKRVRSIDDRRVVNLKLTPEGVAAAKRIPPVLAHVMNADLAGFSRGEWQALLSYLRRMLANAKSADRGAAGG